LTTTLSILAALVLAASAVASTSAVLPTQRSKFAGVTSEHKVNGYKPTINFTTPAGGRSLKGFVFQTLGCFGIGQFPVGVDPFAQTQWHFGPIPVGANGTYSVKGKATTPIPDAGTMNVAISGSFTNAQTVTGKITFSQDQEGATCGPRTLTFTATTAKR
jgi:hypothetical protein